MSVHPTRRAIIGGIGASALAAPFVHAQGKARAVVIGGGFGGATCARALAAMGVAVTLVEADDRYVACPFSNLVIHGSRGIDQQTFGYDGLRKAGVDVVFARAERIEPDARRVLLPDGRTLAYDRLVVAPGIDFRFDALPGYDSAAAQVMPHAWKAGAQTLLLRQQLEAMEDGGVVLMSVPPNPFRCPPGPYERASLIAHYLKTQKPKSKLIVLDSKDTFSKQKLFMAAWQELYPNHLEWVSLAGGGKTVEVDPREKTIITEFGSHKGAVANVIPPQRAGAIAIASGLADRSGWCPIDPVSFESKLAPNVHVIGDAAIAGAMPKSAFSANAQAKHCALAVATMLRGEAAPSPKLINTCYSLVAPDYGISVAGVYHPAKGLLADVEGAGGTSLGGASREFRAREAIYADAWFKVITESVYG
ncbi:MAG: NAD(P)/FAD-dependent oxidoreductase [Beijerinckiaceae bacterium]|nr:NAD(P)/FAD-dependent oxidoreductase [Beijerinckiaceae bacterium]